MNDFLTQLRERLPFILAVAATTLWLLAVTAYVRIHGGCGGLLALAPPDLAVLLAAVGSPLAAFWLIMAVLEQRRALRLFARRIAELAAHNARGQVLETQRLALHDMASSSALLAERLGVMKRDAAAAAWARYGAGDVNVFVHSFLNFAASHPDMATRMAEAVARDAVAGSALAAFVRRYEGLIASEPGDKLVAEIFDDGALGRAYRLFKSADEQAATLLAAAASTSELSPRSEGAAPSV